MKNSGYCLKESLFYLMRLSLEDLKALQNGWNPKWSNSGIWPLISPILKYIGDGKHSIALICLQGG
jgi:hypothetical protein